MKHGIWAQTAVGAVAAGSGNLQAEESNGHRVRGRFPSLAGIGLGLILVWSVAGCHKTPAQDVSGSTVDQNAGDPADANMAPVSGNGAYAPAQSGQPAEALGQNVQYQPQQQGQDYSQQPPAPIERRAPNSGDPGSANQGYADPGYNNADPAYSGDLSDQQAADLYASDLTDEEANDPPPPLPEYDQPPAPDPDYLWTPGYWGWGPGGGYYWVPGSWVAAPYVGALWTPGYWGFYTGRYRFHHGYWGLHIGFYGGVDYGFGYVGHGYYGGYWDHDHFRYNTAVSRVNVNVIRNVYVHNVVINNVVVNNRVTNRVSFNGGRGGVQARPLVAEVAVLHEQRRAPMASQVQVQRDASQNRQQFFNQNQGRPAVAVSARPVVADRSMPAALPRAAGPIGQPAGRNDARPGQAQPQLQGRQGQPQTDTRGLPQGQSQVRQGQVQPETRGLQPQVQAQPQVRQGQPQNQTRGLQPQDQTQPQGRQGQPQSQLRQGQVQPQVRQAQPQQAQPQPQPQVRQAPAQPDFRRAQPQPQPQPQVRQAPQPQPQPQVRQAPQPQPQPQVRQAPQPQPQVRQAPPQPQPQSQVRQAPPQSRPQPATRPAPPPPHPQPAARPAPQPQSNRTADQHDDKGH